MNPEASDALLIFPEDPPEFHPWIVVDPHSLPEGTPKNIITINGDPHTVAPIKSLKKDDNETKT